MMKKIFVFMFALIMLTGFVFATEWGDSITNEFGINSGLIFCEEGTHWFNPVDGSRVLSGNENCFKGNGYPAQKCCPYGGSSCNIENGNCEGVAITNCANYNKDNFGSVDAARDACNNPDFLVGIRTVDINSEQEGFCGSSIPEIDPILGDCISQIVNCDCVWEDNECVGFYESKKVCGEEIVGSGSCKYSLTNTDDRCSTEGVIYFDLQAIWDGGDIFGKGECVGGPRIAPCADTTKLRFFTGFGFVLVILLVTVIYFILLRKKKK